MLWYTLPNRYPEPSPRLFCWCLHLVHRWLVTLDLSVVLLLCLSASHTRCFPNWTTARYEERASGNSGFAPRLRCGHSMLCTCALGCLRACSGSTHILNPFRRVCSSRTTPSRNVLARCSKVTLQKDPAPLPSYSSSYQYCYSLSSCVSSALYGCSAVNAR